ncbi:hypothetical protein VNO77_40834 [Canavalia gladiata]|uniref:Uncharacterized protein n=1 Tax=Canavalia gladiata TaxID=3824 RepID=A0AAN9PRB1_CANGL
MRRVVSPLVEALLTLNAHQEKSLPFPSNDSTPLAFPLSKAPFPTYAMLHQHRPTTLRACDVFIRRSLPVMSSSPSDVWAGCHLLLRSIRL